MQILIGSKRLMSVDRETLTVIYQSHNFSLVWAQISSSIKRLSFVIEENTTAYKFS